MSEGDGFLSSLSNSSIELRRSGRVDVDPERSPRYRSSPGGTSDLPRPVTPNSPRAGPLARSPWSGRCPDALAPASTGKGLSLRSRFSRQTPEKFGLAAATDCARTLATADRRATATAVMADRRVMVLEKANHSLEQDVCQAVTHTIAQKQIGCVGGASSLDGSVPSKGRARCRRRDRRSPFSLCQTQDVTERILDPTAGAVARSPANGRIRPMSGTAAASSVNPPLDSVEAAADQPRTPPAPTDR